MNKCHFAAVILAAGQSKRMGRAKPMLKLRNGLTFLESCVQSFEHFGCRELVVVTSQEVYKQVESESLNLPGYTKVVLNNLPGRGRFYSLQCGLKQVLQSAGTFFHNVDNPFVSETVLKALAAKEKTADVICPAYGGKRGHPVLISRQVAADIISEKNEAWKLRDYLNRYRNVTVQVPDPNILVNINTPEAYERLRGI